MLSGKYFIEIETLEDLKQQYRTLAMKNHPDRGGDVEVMKLINAEYDRFFAQIKDTHKNKDGEIYTKENPETADQFIDIINRLIKMNGVEIEIYRLLHLVKRKYKGTQGRNQVSGVQVAQ